MMKNFSLDDDSTCLLVESLEDRTMLSTVQIFAAGETGQEQLDLFINDGYVRSFENVGGDISARHFEVFTFETNDTLTAEQISVAFGNDLYDPQSGFDRNLYVDRIVIDGVNFQTEAPSVHSTGIWRDGFTGPGNFSTEAFNINAIFTYASEAAENPWTEISVDVAGQTGDERIDILVNGEVVGQYDFGFAGERQVVTFVVDDAIDLSDVRVRFANDLWDPANGYDRNVTLFSISTMNLLTGDTQTALPGDANVYSEGVWRPEDGFVNGLGRGGLLYANGFIELRDGATPSDGTLMLDPSFGINGQIFPGVRPSISSVNVGPQDQILTTLTEFSADSRFGDTFLELRNADGSLNSRFGDNGSVNLETLLFPTLSNQIDFISANASIRLNSGIQFFDDGSILLAGTLDADNFNFSNGLTPIVFKITPDGNLDPNYATQGFFPDGLLQLRSGTVSAAIDSNSDAIIFGPNADPNGSQDLPNLVVTRLNSDGTIDRSFGFEGNVFLDRDQFELGSPASVLVNQFNEILLVSIGAQGLSVTKLDYDGAIDTAFGDNGIVTEASFSGTVKLDGQERLIFSSVERASPFFANNVFARYDANGLRDTDFGVNGVARYQLSPPIELLDLSFTDLAANTFEVDDEDRILIFSTASLNFVERGGIPGRTEIKGTLVVRLDDQGMLDTNFDSKGYTLLGVGDGGLDLIVGTSVIDSSGNVILSGSLFTTTDGSAGGFMPTIERLKFV